MHPGGGQLVDLQHVHDVRPVDAHELRPGQQQRLVVLQGADHLPHLPIGQVEVQVLAADLHIGQLGKGHPHQRGPGLQRQPVLGTLLTQGQPVQHREQQLAADGLEQVLQRPHAVALVGEAGGGGEEHDVGGGVEGADLPGGLHAVDAGHHHVQQVQGEPLVLGGVQHVARAAERPVAQGDAPLRLPLLQQRGQRGQLLRLIITDSDVHGYRLLSLSAPILPYPPRLEKSQCDISCRKNIHFRKRTSSRGKKRLY